MRLFRRVLLVFLVMGAFFSSTASGQESDLLDRPARPARSPERCVLLDVAQAGNRLVAVGERGIVILSDDTGRNWRQAKMPTSVSLTAVAFPTPKAGWAIGHSGVVLHTEDGGETWTRQLDGKLAAQLALQAAEANLARVPKAGPKFEAANRYLKDAQRLVSDGPDKPLLALHFKDERNGLVVGAYGLIFSTADGGKSWQSWMDRLDNRKGNHIYALAVSDKAIYLAGEQGLVLRSLDGGATFTTIETPYKGTYFSVALTPAGQLVLAGMRGNVYTSSDQGKKFLKSEVPIPINFSAITSLSDGRLLFANQAGQLFESRDQGRTLQVLPLPPLPPIAAMKELGGGVVLTVGVAGAIPLPLAAARAAGNIGGAQ